MSSTEEIVERAIDYVDRMLDIAPSYRQVAIAGLRKLRDTLTPDCAGDSAVRRLDAYIARLEGRSVPPES